MAEATADGHADRFWALALALHAGSDPSAPIDYIPVPTHAGATIQCVNRFTTTAI